MKRYFPRKKKMDWFLWALEQETDECLEFPWNPSGPGYGFIWWGKLDGKLTD